MDLGPSPSRTLVQQPTRQPVQPVQPVQSVQAAHQQQAVQPTTAHLGTQAPTLSTAQPATATLAAGQQGQPAAPHLTTPAPALTPEQKFDAIVQDGQTRKLTDLDVVRAVGFQAAVVGGGAAAAFGLGRSFGADAAELAVKAAYRLNMKDQLGVGSDKGATDHSLQHAGQTSVIPVARAVGATVGGGVGAVVGNVLAPRVAALAGRQFKPIPAEELVPDHVAELLTGGRPYGAEGVARLRAQVTEAHGRFGAIGGAAHVNGGRAAFGAVNAVRGGSQGGQAVGLYDMPISTGVSATAGAATGIFAGVKMANHRLAVPDANHTGDGNAPMVDVPTFSVGTPAPIPNRFTGPTATQTAMNIAAGTVDRIVHMNAATLPLAAANMAGALVSASLPKAASTVGPRIVKALELGGGVLTAVSPWFKSQPTIANNDKARIDRQQPRSADVELGTGGPR